ncbi:30S ribosomal protein S10 [candidate division WWE3 bacterium RIFCSPLOWO2_01_FULL_39_13]|uniref:Small ribosomal subunit protein uS10 n=1 Tax=candidate division WWE3 bacterium RIFCSPLOWO2_01_FULL_39_13 TaxID=1802624 RepID=A0A1F4V4Q7_UNCKA|nr:MAG: 30S ribosomal protein S10 [candidate division WWE3 bacterium RIFCSPLOWO2_01_FULL_39_13]
MASDNKKVLKNRLRVKLKSYDVGTIDQSAQRIIDVAVRTGAKISGPIALPTRVEIFSYQRSPSNDKRSFEQFERRTHSRIIDILEPTAGTISELSNLKLSIGVHILIKS